MDKLGARKMIRRAGEREPINELGVESRRCQSAHRGEPGKVKSAGCHATGERAIHHSCVVFSAPPQDITQLHLLSRSSVTRPCSYLEEFGAQIRVAARWGLMSKHQTTEP